MTTSAKHIWTRTANRREPAKAIFFFNQIVFLIMFLFLPKLLIRHLEDFLLRGKCNKLVRSPCLPPSRCPPALPVAGAAGVPMSRSAGAASPVGTDRRNVPLRRSTGCMHEHVWLVLLCAGAAMRRAKMAATHGSIRPGGTRSPSVPLPGPSVPPPVPSAAGPLPSRNLSALRCAVSALQTSSAARYLPCVSPGDFPPSAGRGMTAASEHGD